MPLTPEEFRRLVSSIDVLNTEVAGLRAAMINADRRARWARSVAIVGVVAGIIGGAVGLGGILVGADAQRTADDIEASRREVSVSSCVQQNVQTDRTRAAFIHSITLIADNSKAQQADDPDAIRRIDALLAAYTLSVAQQLPYRDCSPAGINNYLKSPPPDPNRGN